jgi:hypothetical protein
MVEGFLDVNVVEINWSLEFHFLHSFAVHMSQFLFSKNPSTKGIKMELLSFMVQEVFC